VDAPSLSGSPVEAQTGKEATHPGDVNTEWVDAIREAAPSAMPTIVPDGGRLGSRTVVTPPIDAPPPQPAETQKEEPAAAEEEKTAGQTDGEESFVARANAERERLYQRRTDQVKTQQYEHMREETRTVRERQRGMYTKDQIGQQLRKDPFGFMRQHGVGLQDLNKELDSGNGSGPENPVSKEVFELQKQAADTSAQLKQMQESTAQASQFNERQQALSTLNNGLEQYKDSYPGLYALFASPQSGTSPAEQVLIGLERAQEAGRPMSANEVASRLETEARTHFERLSTAYKPPVDQTAPLAQTQQPPNAVHHTAGITNQTAAPARPLRPTTRQEEIAQAAQLIRFV